MPELHVNVGEPKKVFSDLLARVAYGGETVVITRPGWPMARLVPPTANEDAEHIANVRGWLDDDDPYLHLIDTVVAARPHHIPRVVGTKKRRRPRRIDALASESWFTQR